MKPSTILATLVLVLCMIVIRVRMVAVFVIPLIMILRLVLEPGDLQIFCRARTV